MHLQVLTIRESKINFYQDEQDLLKLQQQTSLNAPSLEANGNVVINNNKSTKKMGIARASIVGLTNLLSGNKKKEDDYHSMVQKQSFIDVCFLQFYCFLIYSFFLNIVLCLFIHSCVIVLLHLLIHSVMIRTR